MPATTGQPIQQSQHPLTIRRSTSYRMLNREQVISALLRRSVERSVHARRAAHWRADFKRRGSDRGEHKIQTSKCPQRL